jgi:hypothetical protein
LTNFLFGRLAKKKIHHGANGLGILDESWVESYKHECMCNFDLFVALELLG